MIFKDDATMNSCFRGYLARAFEYMDKGENPLTEEQKKELRMCLNYAFDDMTAQDALKEAIKNGLNY
jgi:hypothetical protein